MGLSDWPKYLVTAMHGAVTHRRRGPERPLIGRSGFLILLSHFSKPGRGMIAYPVPPWP